MLIIKIYENVQDYLKDSNNFSIPYISRDIFCRGHFLSIGFAKITFNKI